MLAPFGNYTYSEDAMFCVVFRTGSVKNFKWERTSPVCTRGEANEQARMANKQGFAAYVENHEMSLSVGLPTTFSFWQHDTPVQSMLSIKSA